MDKNAWWSKRSTGEKKELRVDRVVEMVSRLPRPPAKDFIALPPKVYNRLKLLEMVDTLGLSPLARMRGKNAVGVRFRARHLFRKETGV